jgi:hypothetical protein
VPAVRRLEFELLPPGKWNVTKVVEHYRRLAQQSNAWTGGREVDYQRLQQIQSLGPTRCWVGKKSWAGYVVFEFPGNDRVILECPLTGNAIYVLPGDWMDLIKLSKAELRGRTKRFQKIVHRGPWLNRLRAALERSQTKRARPERPVPAARTPEAPKFIYLPPAEAERRRAIRAARWRSPKP